MSNLGASLLNFKNTNKDQIQKIFSVADGLLASNEDQKNKLRLNKFVAALLFFEPSTRTRMSFQTACYRLGGDVLLMDGASGTSLEKGETEHDTILNIAAMKPDVIVVRCGDNLNLQLISELTDIPIINAGWGCQGHPTQALLDAYTIRKNLGDVSGKKIIIVGDIKHSRVAKSNFELLTILGAEVAICGPKTWLVEGYKEFLKLDEALSWSDVAMFLRVQNERHTGVSSADMSAYQLNSESLKYLKSSSLIMHPGPVNWGTEITSEVLKDPRCKILEQVTNGVFIRKAILINALGVK